MKSSRIPDLSEPVTLENWFRRESSDKITSSFFEGVLAFPLGESHVALFNNSIKGRMLKCFRELLSISLD